MKLKKSEKDLEKFTKKISEETKSGNWTLSIEKKSVWQKTNKINWIMIKKMTDYFES